MDQPFHLGSDGIYRCQAFQQFAWQTHGFGTRAANPPVAVTLRQIHSAIVINAQGLADRQCEGDALVTDELGLSVGVRTADCVPILLLDTKRRAVAAVHAGWRGTAAEIAGGAVRKMQTDFATDPRDVQAAVGPCIRACCYEVGPEVANRFASIFPEWPAISGKTKLDLAEANRRQLLSAGVAAENIFDSKLCTSCEIQTFFSFRREPENTGRLVTAIVRLL